MDYNKKTNAIETIEAEIFTLETELALLAPAAIAVKPKYSLTQTNVIAANFNRAADLDHALRILSALPRRQAILRHLDYLRRRLYALRPHAAPVAGFSFAA